MRKIKQIVFGILFVIILSAIGWGVYNLFLKPAPSCFNNVQDQGETGVDCGGPCVSCELKTVKILSVSQGWPKWFKATDSSIGIAAEIYNPNPSWAAKSFDYVFSIKDQFGATIQTINGSSFIYGGQLRYVVEPRVDVDPGKVATVEMAISNPQWASVNDYSQPDVEAQEVKTDKSDLMYVSGKAINRSELDFSSVVVDALLFNKDGQFVAASKTIVDNLQKFDSKDFKVSFSKDLSIYQPGEGVFSFERTLKVGDSGADVNMLQQYLREGGFLNRDATGYFDTITGQAIAAMQKQVGLPVTGEIDELTRQALNAVIAAAASSTQPTQLQLATSVDASRTKVLIEAQR